MYWLMIGDIGTSQMNCWIILVFDFLINPALSHLFTENVVVFLVNDHGLGDPAHVAVLT